MQPLRDFIWEKVPPAGPGVSLFGGIVIGGSIYVGSVVFGGILGGIAVLAVMTIAMLTVAWLLTGLSEDRRQQGPTESD